MPYVNVWVDNDDLLDEIDDDDLVEKLNRRGYACFKNGVANGHEFSSVKHLMDCGMINEAKAEAFLIVGRAIGRSL
jgi:hypothetical protein